MAIKLKRDAFVRNLVKGHKLASHLDLAIGKGEFEWTAQYKPKGGDDAWHPSGDCTPTPLELYRKATSQTQQKPSTGLLKSFQVGHWWHAYLQHIVVEKLGFATWDAIEVLGEKRWGDKPYQWARGSADVAPCSIPGHGDFIVDFKTMRGSDFKQQGIPQWCAAKYECQMNCYMDWLDIDQTIILCISKDSPHEFKEFIFDRNQPLIDAIYSKWKLVGDCIEKQIEPDPDYDVPLPLVGPKL